MRSRIFHLVVNLISFTKNFEGPEIREMGRVCNLVHKGFAKKNADTLFFSNSDEISSFAKND